MPGVSDTAENELQQENGEDEEDNIDDNDSGNEDDGEEQAGLKGYQEDSDIEETTTPKDFHKTPLPLIKKLTVRESALADEIWNLLGIPDPDNTLESLGDSDYVPISFRPDYDHPLANQLSKLLSGAPAIMEPIRASTPSTPQPSDSQTLSSRVQSPNVMLDPEHEQFQPSRTSTPVNDFLLRTRTPSPAVGIEAGGTPSTATPVPGMREHVLRRTLTRGSSFRLQLERDL
ncbi:hypothetical protein BDR26DRAFT_851626 [Obelidium mucronatum]|nr:hypothetical protein BDR26DRAFT_851626 [Obelidium mucronatum]